LLQALGDRPISIGGDLKPHRRAFAAILQLSAH